ncbi:MAG: twin-arginine translocase TatA/TatE family subunit [Methylocystis sp.]
MGGLSIWHWIIVGGVVFVLFGGKFKISDVMTDVAKGIKAFKKGMAEDETASTSEEAPKSVESLPREHAALDKASDAKKL